MTRLHGTCLGLTVVLTGLAVAQPPTTSPGQAALDAAGRNRQYLFLLFHKEDDAATQAMKETLDDALPKHGVRAASVMVKATDPAEKPLIDRWGLARTPMPIVLAVAPNGAITGGFPLKLSEKDVAGAFVSPGTAACLKATQARKLVLLCVQPAGARDLPAGVKEFKADAGYGPATEVITIAATDPTEAGFLQALQIQPGAVTVTAFLAPPASLLGTFAGEMTKGQLVEKLKAAQCSCCPGGKCGPGGCCPGGKCNPRQ
jgi:hypothetical protein